MAENHPSIADFEALFGKALQSAQRARTVMAAKHLLAGCPSCWALLRANGWHARRAEGRPQHPFRADYGEAFARTAQRLAAFLAPEAAPEKPLDTLLGQLLDLPEEARELQVTQPPYAHPGVVRRLIEQSHGVRYQEPRMMLQLARLAKLAAEACATETAGSAERLADLRARAWGHYGNSFRVCGELVEAEEALDMAQRYREAGTGDPSVRARLLEQWASLRTFQGHFDQAIALAEEAERTYNDLGETHNVAGSLVHKAIAAIYAGQTEKAIRTLNRAIPKIDPEENPHLLLAACHNLIRAYIDLEQTEQALSLYFEAKELYKEFTDPRILLRAGWQEGQLLRDLDHLGAAEAALLQARQGFVEKDLALEVALVSLDLASVYVRAGKVEEVKNTVAEAIPIFRALRVEREVINALLQLQQAAGQKQQALDLICTLNTRLATLSRTTIK